MEFKYLLFFSGKDLLRRQRILNKLDDGNLIRKCVLKRLDVAVFMVKGL